MKLSKLSIACALAGALSATSASATTYSVDIVADTGEIAGTITVSGTTVTAFTGTATGFVYMGNDFGGIWDGPVTLGQGSDGPDFSALGDNQWNSSGPYYVSPGNALVAGGVLLTNGKYSFRVYDYTDTNNNYGDQLAWFVSSGFNPAIITVSATISTSATPLPAALPLFATGLGALGLLARRRKRKAALPA
jgi:hypothetical protein